MLGSCRPLQGCCYFFPAFIIHFHLLHFHTWLTAHPKASFISISEFSGNISIFMQDFQGFCLMCSQILQWNYIQYINSLTVCPGIQRAKLKAGFSLLYCVSNPGLILVKSWQEVAIGVVYSSMKDEGQPRWPALGRDLPFLMVFQEQGRLWESAEVFMQYLEHMIGGKVIYGHNGS